GTLNLTEDKQYKINAFDWQEEFKEAFQDGGFDVVIGNPPWGGELTDDEIVYFDNNTNDKTHDTYILFIIQALERLLKHDSIFSFIIPRFVQFNRNMETIRRRLLHGLVSLTEVGICFKQANTECLIFVYKNGSNVKFTRSLFYYPNEKPIFNRKISHKFIEKFPNCIYNVYVSDKEFAVLEKMSKNERTLADVNPIGKIIRGMEGYTVNITTKRTDCKTIVGGELSRYIQDVTLNCFVNEKYKEVSRLSTVINKNKVLIRRVANRLIANVDYERNAFTKNLYAFYDSVYDLKFVLGLLNSRLMTFFLKKQFTMRKEEIFPEIVSYQLKTLPIPNLDISKKSDKSTHDKLITMVDNMLELKRREKNEQNQHTKTMIARQITALDKDIDKFVYALYDLTKDEISVVENKR
ncbi:MAG: Eco57I restriction-modification methylase domain-containing protein, partial [Planctomycetaceae bacterium]|nr:Eco57I restriction-modification methylase domain-containing protein [Planctomycetaceae bacterium]